MAVGGKPLHLDVANAVSLEVVHHPITRPRKPGARLDAVELGNAADVFERALARILASNRLKLRLRNDVLVEWFRRGLLRQGLRRDPQQGDKQQSKRQIPGTAHEDFFLPTLGMRRALHHGSRRANSSTAERASKEAGHRGHRETEKQEERTTNWWEKRPAVEDQEWSGRGDSNPRLQLGKLSYYPYTTAARGRPFLITRGGSGDKARIVGLVCRPGTRRPPRLTDLNDARRLDDRRFLLPFGKFRGLGAVGVNPAKLLAVVIIDGDLPVPMFAPLVLTELGFSSFLHEYRQQSRRTMPI